MKTTLIGHACLLIQSKDTTLLSDPIFFDTLWEEVNIHCPNFDIDLDNFPQVDILNISHRHQDHFDIRTLAFLAKDKRILAPDATVLAPNDEVLLETLKELEFSNIQVVEDFESIRIKDFTLTPTPSMNPHDYFPEHGLLIHDGEVTIWNQVDTIVIPKIIQYIQKLYGQVDFAHARYLPLLEGNFTFHKPVNLPFDEYSSFLKVVKMLGSKFVVPGSAGFRYRDEYFFLNQYSFPTTQDQFIEDLRGFCPEVEGSTFFPGDIAEITKRGTTIHRKASHFIHPHEDDSHLVEFKPVAEVPSIRTLTQDPAEHYKEWETVLEFLEDEFINLLLENQSLDTWRQWQVHYQLEVFGLDDSEIWTLDFADNDLTYGKDRTGKKNLYEGIGCSELYRLIGKQANWDFVGINGQYRTFHNIYKIDNGQFEPFSQEKKFPTPLTEVFPSGREMDREKFMKDVRRWKNHY